MSWTIAHLELLAVALVIVPSVIVILQQRRSPQATLAWLLLLVLLPYIAVPAFLVFGFRKRGRLSAAMQPLPTLPADIPQIDRLLRHSGLRGPTDGNRFRLLPDSGEAWEALLEVVQSAQARLDITLYALGNDAVGREFCDALAERARAGVRVRMVLDAIGAMHRPRRALTDLRAAGAQVLVSSALLHHPMRGQINLRNHRKMVIADGQRVWAGGRNVGIDYLGPVPQEGRWSDLSFTIAGPVAASYDAVFDSDWGSATEERQDEPVAIPDHGQSAGDGTTIQLVPAGPDVPGDPLHDAMVYAAHAAQRRLWIVTPYFLPTGPLNEALAIACRRGLDVRLVVPAASNQILADLARGAFLRDLAQAGGKVHLFGPGMIHAKAVLSDDMALVGSANLDARSLLLNYEVMALLYSQSDVDPVRIWMQALFDRSPVGLPKSGHVRHTIEGLFRLGSPIL